MSDKTKIEWTDATWNIALGCDRVSAGCDHCYAIGNARIRESHPNPKVSGPYTGLVEHRSGRLDWTGRVTFVEDRLDQPLRWKRPRRIFVNAQSDLFHDQITDEQLARVFAVMALAPRHTFQVLTKRPGRMRSLLSNPDFAEMVGWEATGLSPYWTADDSPWPLPNLWVGVSVEDQKWADVRIPLLIDTPAAVRFLSCEPLLGPVNLLVAAKAYAPDLDALRYMIGWVIVGGESGPGARPMHPDWARRLRDDCTSAGVPFHFKQRGEWTWSEPGNFRIPTKPYTDRVGVMHPAGMTALTKGNSFNPFERAHPFWTTRIERVGKAKAGRELDGRTWDEYPT